MLKDMIKARPTSRGMYSALVSTLVSVQTLVRPSGPCTRVWTGKITEKENPYNIAMTFSNLSYGTILLVEASENRDFRIRVRTMKWVTSLYMIVQGVCLGCSRHWDWELGGVGGGGGGGEVGGGWELGCGGGGVWQRPLSLMSSH